MPVRKVGKLKVFFKKKVEGIKKVTERRAKERARKFAQKWGITDKKTIKKLEDPEFLEEAKKLASMHPDFLASVELSKILKAAKNARFLQITRDILPLKSVSLDFPEGLHLLYFAQIVVPTMLKKARDENHLIELIDAVTEVLPQLPREWNTYETGLWALSEILKKTKSKEEFLELSRKVTNYAKKYKDWSYVWSTLHEMLKKIKDKEEFPELLRIVEGYSKKHKDSLFVWSVMPAIVRLARDKEELRKIMGEVDKIAQNYPEKDDLPIFVKFVLLEIYRKVDLNFILHTIKRERKMWLTSMNDILGTSPDIMKKTHTKLAPKHQGRYWNALWEEAKVRYLLAMVGGKMPRVRQKKPETPEEHIRNSEERRDIAYNEIKRILKKHFGEEIEPKRINTKSIYAFVYHKEYGDEITHGLLKAYFSGGNKEAERYINSLKHNKGYSLDVPEYEKLVKRSRGVNWTAFDEHAKELVENIGSFLAEFDEKLEKGEIKIKRKVLDRIREEHLGKLKDIHAELKKMSPEERREIDLDEIHGHLKEIKRYVQIPSLKEAVTRVDNLKGLLRNVEERTFTVRLKKLEGLDRLFLGTDANLATLGSCLRLPDGSHRKHTKYNATNDRMPILVLENETGQRSRVQLVHVDEKTLSHINPLGKYNNLGVDVDWVEPLIRTALHNRKDLFLHGENLDPKRLKSLGFVKREMEIPWVWDCYQDVKGRVEGWYAPYEKLREKFGMPGKRPGKRPAKRSGGK